MRCSCCGRFMKLVFEEATQIGVVKHYECKCGSQLRIAE